MHYKSFETERLFLVPTSEKDAEFVFKLLNSPKWIRFIGERNIRNQTEAAEYIRMKMRPQLEKLGFSNYTVIRKSDRKKIGSCGLYDREGLDGVDIGFAFLPEHEKKGYAFEASRTLKKAAMEEFGLEKIHAITDKENVASQKLLEKLGLTFRGLTRLPNETEELFLYTIEF